MERKMKFLSNLKKGILFASFTVAALLVLSCEIGLGAAVDTERPKLQITYPPKGAVIMDNFTLAGTVSDDVGLNYLKVTLTNKDLKTTYTYSSKEGQVLWVDPGKNWSKGTTWTASIGKKTEGQTLYNGWDLPDGEYFKAQKFTADYLLKEQGCNIDLCGYPHEEEEVLDPLDTIREYQERRTALNAEIDKVLAELEALLPGGVKE